MRIFLTCMKCFAEAGKPSEEYSSAHLEDSGLYHMKCSAGHETITCLQQMKFEVLFDLGLYAIVDGYHREAVTSFTSALERFFEFYVYVRCLQMEISDEIYTAAWKQIANQSERQLGAFIFIHTLSTKRSPALLSSKEVEFRNSVIHKGKIPSHTEAMEYGEKVFAILQSTLDDLRKDAASEIERAVMHHISEQKQSITNQNVAFMSIGTLVSLNRADRQPTLKEWVEMLKAQRGLMRS